MSSSYDFSKRNKFSPSQNNEKKEIGSQQESFVDNRESTDQITQLQNSVDNSLHSQEITQLQEKADNTTGMPDDLKQGIESLSGQDMSDVKVHYNSDKPAQLQAHAYAKGTDIHIASGQEKHLPHEAWHVAQQKQGRVEPTMQMKGNVNVNDDAGLEKEADVMGDKAASFVQRKSENNETLQRKSSNNGVVQLEKTKAPPKLSETAGKKKERDPDMSKSLPNMDGIEKIDKETDKKRMDAAKEDYLTDNPLRSRSDDKTVRSSSDAMSQGKSKENYGTGSVDLGEDVENTTEALGNLGGGHKGQLGSAHLTSGGTEVNTKQVGANFAIDGTAGLISGTIELFTLGRGLKKGKYPKNERISIILTGLSSVGGIADAGMKLSAHDKKMEDIQVRQKDGTIETKLGQEDVDVLNKIAGFGAFKDIVDTCKDLHTSYTKGIKFFENRDEFNKKDYAELSKTLLGMGISIANASDKIYKATNVTDASGIAGVPISSTIVNMVKQAIDLGITVSEALEEKNFKNMRDHITIKEKKSLELLELIYAVDKDGDLEKIVLDNAFQYFRVKQLQLFRSSLAKWWTKTEGEGLNYEDAKRQAMANDTMNEVVKGEKAKAFSESKTLERASDDVKEKAKKKGAEGAKTKNIIHSAAEEKRKAGGDSVDDAVDELMKIKDPEFITEQEKLYNKIEELIDSYIISDKIAKTKWSNVQTNAKKGIESALGITASILKLSPEPTTFSIGIATEILKFSGKVAPKIYKELKNYTAEKALKGSKMASKLANPEDTKSAKGEWDVTVANKLYDKVGDLAQKYGTKDLKKIKLPKSGSELVKETITQLEGVGIPVKDLSSLDDSKFYERLLEGFKPKS